MPREDEPSDEPSSSPAVHGSSDGTLHERHDVPRERSRLVRQHAPNLSELFVERRRSNAARHARVSIVKFAIERDPTALNHLDELERDVQRDGYQRVEKHHETNKLRGGGAETTLDVRPRPSRAQVPVMATRSAGATARAVVSRVPSRLRGGERDADGDLKRPDENHEDVHVPLEPRHLVRRSRHVAHEFGVRAGKNHHPEDPIDVAKRGSAKEKIIGAQRRVGRRLGVRLGVRLRFGPVPLPRPETDPFPLERVQLIVGGLAFNPRVV